MGTQQVKLERAGEKSALLCQVSGARMALTHASCCRDECRLFRLQTQISMPSPRITGYLHTSLSRATALCIGVQFD